MQAFSLSEPAWHCSYSHPCKVGMQLCHPCKGLGILQGRGGGCRKSIVSAPADGTVVNGVRNGEEAYRPRKQELARTPGWNSGAAVVWKPLALNTSPESVRGKLALEGVTERAGAGGGGAAAE